MSDNYVAWLRWSGDEQHRHLVVCDSNSEGAFKVYRFDEQRIRAEERAKLEAHTKAVERFLNQMYCTIIDPLATGNLSVDQVCAELLKQAKADRQLIHNLEDGMDEEREACAKQLEEMADALDQEPPDREPPPRSSDYLRGGARAIRARGGGQ